MFIRKESAEKLAVRINSAKDVPEGFEDTISIMDNLIVAVNSEGAFTYPLGSIIGYEYKANTPTGKGAFHIDPTFVEEVNGKFYSKTTVLTAEPIEGPYTLDTEWGVQCLPASNRGYLVTYANGTQAIVAEGTDSIETYFVCTEDGEIICSLTDYNREER